MATTNKGKLAINGGKKAVPDGLKKCWPDISAEDKTRVLAVLERNLLSGVHGPEAAGLEADWAAYTGSRHVLSFNSGTAAIHTALYALGLGPGDEVITSAYSFSGSFHPVLQQNAIPVFVDIDLRTHNIDVSQIEAKITDRTRALLPVHIEGTPCDMDEIQALSRTYGIPVIEDACQAHGTHYKGKKSGTMGVAGCFSLNVTKNLCGGEGGLLNTDNDELAERARTFRTFGEKVGRQKEKIRPYSSYTIGWNYRTQELPAALARSQLKRLDGYNGIARRNAEYLSRELGELPGLIPPHVPPDRSSNYYKYRLRFEPGAFSAELPPSEVRDRLLAALLAEGVSATLWHVAPLPAYPIFQSLEGYGKGCPWSCPYYGKRIHYDPAHYPQAQRLLDTSIIVNDETYSITIQDLELMEHYVAAFRKILGNPDELFARK
jgi:perosamine synthetase